MTRPVRSDGLLYPAPRLLPATMFCLAALFAVKSVTLIGAAIASAPPAPAQAATPQDNASGAASGGHRVPPPAAPPVAMPEPTGLAGAVEPAAVPPITDSERAVLLELRQRRQELDSREQALAGREALLAAAERKIASRVDELKALQARLEALDTARKERDEASWRGLVKVYETMKPREAAGIMNDLDMAVMLSVLDRMREAKAAPILAAMAPDRARQVTAELAQMRQRANNLARAGN
jgi:flagellar motility protein MotE (MotC chaperone)